MVRTVLVCAAILILGLSSAATDKPQSYRNAEFGIVLPVPEGVQFCPTPEDEHDHGPVMVLDRFEAKGCNDAERRRLVEVFASFNAMQATKTLNKLLQSECADAGRRRCLPAPPRLRVGGMPSAEGSVKHSDGWIDIIVVTQAGRPDPAFDASVPSVNYVLRLRTRNPYVDKDLGTFRTVLATIQLFPGQTTPKEKPHRK